MKKIFAGVRVGGVQAAPWQCAGAGPGGARGRGFVIILDRLWPQLQTPSGDCR